MPEPGDVGEMNGKFFFNRSSRLRGSDLKGGVTVMKKKGKISLERLRHMLVCTGMALCLVGAAMPDGLSHAQRRHKPEVKLPNFYPDGFHGYGRLNRIGQDEVVIRDSLKRLAPVVTYHTPDNQNATKAYFTRGDLVGYMIDSDRQVVSLWLIE